MKFLKRKCDLFVLRLVGLLVSVYLMLLIAFFDYSDLGLIIPTNFNWHPSFLYVCLLGLVVLEFLNSKPIIRLLYLCFGGLVLLAANDINKVNSFIWFLSIIYTFLILIAYLRVKPKRYREVEKKDGKLPIAVFSKRQLFINKLATILYLVLAFVFMMIWSMLVGEYLMLVGAVYILVGFVIYAYFVIKYNPVNKLVKLINFELKYNEFSRGIEELKNNNLHIDSFNYLVLLEANYCVLYNKEESLKIFENVKEPQFKTYNETYKLLKVCYFINKDEDDKANKLINELMGKSIKYRQQLKILQTTIRIKDASIIIDNIEDIYKINTRVPFTNLANANTLMNYYYSRGNNDKAKEYAMFILEKGKEFFEIYQKAQIIVEL